MENLQIGLFEDKSQVKKITEEQYITPLVEVLSNSAPLTVEPPKEIPQTIQNSLDNLFPEQKYEDKDIQKAKQILGKIADQLNGDQIRDVVTEVNYLVNTWLDDYEKDIFDGQTLMELLHEKGSS
jgi:outer membrane protein OmpA-like peptidoglycan-associated protein